MEYRVILEGKNSLNSSPYIPLNMAMRDSGFPEAERGRISALCKNHNFQLGSFDFKTEHRLGEEYIKRLNLFGIKIESSRDYQPPQFRIVRPVIDRGITTTISGASPKRNRYTS